jgi:hypothetical protein
VSLFPITRRRVLKNPISRFLKTRILELGQASFLIVRVRFLKTCDQPVCVGPKAVSLCKLVPENPISTFCHTNALS